MTAELIARLESADGPSRELDCLIAAAVDWQIECATITPANAIKAFGLDWMVESADLYNSIFNQLPRYTTSIDAAMTLVPECHFWSICMKGETTGYSACCQERGDALEWHDAATPALALAAAALKARHQPKEPT